MRIVAAERSLDGRGQSYGQLSGDESEPPLMWNANYAGDGTRQGGLWVH